MIDLKHFKNKYPMMEIQDIIKLYLQAYLGPAHLMPNKDRLKQN